jgi:hypothetical protein
MADITLKNVSVRVVNEPGQGSEVFLTCPDPLLNASFHSKEVMDIKPAKGVLVFTPEEQPEKEEPEKEESTDEQ